MTELSLDASRAARDQGMANVAAAAADLQWRAAVDDVIDGLAASGRKFTADDIRRYGVGEPHHPNAWGPRFNAAARRGEIRKVGYRQSSRVPGHARLIAVWRGVTR